MQPDGVNFSWLKPYFFIWQNSKFKISKVYTIRLQRYNIYKLDIVVSNQLISRWIKLPWGQVREVEAAEETGQRVFGNLEVWFG